MTEPPIALEDIRDQVARVLGKPVGSLTEDSDLIASGLDSIRMMSLAGSWRKQGFAVGFAELAASPTLERWHEILRAAPRLVSRSAPAPEQQAEEAEEEAAAFPLAPMQHAQWAGRDGGQRLGGVAAHLYVEFDGAGLDPYRLAAAVDQLVQRHPMLRAQILPDGTQRVLPSLAKPAFAAVDLREAGEDEARLRLAEIRAAKSCQRLAVHEGQVIDVLLVSLPPLPAAPGARSRLCLDVDMVAADAMSYRVLVADLAALYRGAPLEKLQRTFRQHLVGRLAARDEAAEADRLWWAQRLDEMPSPPQLPVVDGSDHAPDARTVRHHHWVGPERKAALYARCHEHGVTPAMALASVFAAAVGNWSANSKFLLNLPLFTREASEGLDLVVGDFTSSVLLDVDLSQPATVGERANAVQRAFHTAAAHSAYAGLSVLRDLSRLHGEQVLADVVYTSAIGLGELFAESTAQAFGNPVHIISQGPQVALDAQVTEVSGGLLLNWDVREPRLRPGVAEAMFAWYAAEVDRLADDPAHWSAPSGAGALPQEQRAVREALRAPGLAPSRGSGQTLHGGFFERAEEDPDAVAVIAQDGTSVSYGELRGQALAVAGALVDMGVRRGDAVAVALPKGAAQTPALLGVLAAGGVYVPVGVDQPLARRQQMSRAAGARAAIVETAADQCAPDVPAVEIARAALHCRPLPQPVPATSDDLAYVLFTSGSTGVPKGVELRHGAPMNTIAAVVDKFAITGADRCLSLSPLECDWSVFDLFGMLSAGGSVVVVDEASRREPALWAELIREHEVTYLGWMPGWLDLLLDASTGPLPSLRAVLAGGDWVSADLPRRLRARAPRTRFAGLGGATETAIHSTAHETTDPPAHWRSIPFGAPLAGVACRVVNPRGEDCPDWAVGEYWVGGEGIANGYRGDPERTAERFVRQGGERWYRTGDLVRSWPDGTIEFVGRADHRVKVRGYGVELGDVETALRRVPGVARAVAVTLEAVVSGKTATRLAAIVSREAGSREAGPADALDAARVRAALEHELPAHMIPETVVVVDEMPLTLVGKLDRAAARRLAEEVGPESGETAPRTRLEAALAHVLHEVLDRRIGVDEDFFRFGVDSVFAIKAVARIREWLDAPSASVADFFAARTVAGLARRLAEREEGPERLEQVAEIYLEVAAMSADEVMAQINAAQVDEENSYAR
ncbi:MAG: amino acid adenylation domain-containing protein [Segniliparus sp.]|uniref:non-ribosomal peptide synthetase n=1 Tax=Segniliparus sp. TaxID=2804064 RepID=UPI003F3FD9DC